MKRFVLIPIALALFGCGKEAATLKPFPTLAQPHMNQTEMLQRVNAARAAGYDCGKEGVFPPAPPLTWNDLLEKSAAGHAKDMSEKHYFDHKAPDGSAPSDRITRAGYRWTTCGENIAKGQTSIQEVVQGWLHSPGHCRNIMNASFTQLGASEFNSHWVQNFGRP